MANHVRQQIRERIATDLTGLTTTGTNVFQSRVYPLESGNLPGLLIYTQQETSNPDEMGSNRTLSRELSVKIEAYCQATSNFDDTVDTIIKEVEIALAGDPTINSLAQDCYIESTDITYDASGDQPVGYATISYYVNYFTKQLTPDTAIP